MQWMTNRKTHREVAQTRVIVEGNGHGNVTQMMEKLLDKAERHDLLLSALSGHLSDHTVADAVAFESFATLLRDHRNIMENGG